MLTREFYEMRGTRLVAAVVATLAALAAGLLLAPGVAHAYEVNLSIRGAGKVTETTPANLVGRDCSPGGSGGLQSSEITPIGEVGATCSPGDPDGDYGWGWTVRYVAEAKPGYDFVRWQSNGSSQNPVICDGANGSSIYTGSACQFGTFNNLQTQAVFVDDTAPVMATLSGPFQPVNGPAHFFFWAFSDPTLKLYECRVTPLVQPSYRLCSSGVSFDPATDGTYTFEVRARDYSNNVSDADSWQWIVDKTLPNTTLNTGVGPAEGSTVETGNATFEFSSPDAQGGSFECKLDKGSTTGSWSPSCGSPKTYSNLTDARYTFSVRAKDAAGNVDSSPEERHWTVLNVPTVVESSLVPIRGQTGVLRTTNVSATFSEEMDANSLRDVLTDTSTTFKLQQYNKKTKKWKTVPATISLSNTNMTVTLDPFGATEGTTETPLAANKKFRGFITGGTNGVKDLAGNPLARNVIWTFFTGGS